MMTIGSCELPIWELMNTLGAEKYSVEDASPKNPNSL